MSHTDRGRWWWLSVALWTVVAVLAGFVEWLGLRKGDDGFPPLTQILKTYLPRWGLALGIGGLSFWLLQHFVIS